MRIYAKVYVFFLENKNQENWYIHKVTVQGYKTQNTESY